MLWQTEFKLKPRAKVSIGNTFLVESDFFLIPKNSNIDVRKICYILESKTAYQARGSQRGRDASNEYSASKAVQKFCITYAGTHFQTTQDILTRMVQVLVRAGLRAWLTNIVIYLPHNLASLFGNFLPTEAWWDKIIFEVNNIFFIKHLIVR